MEELTTSEQSTGGKVSTSDQDQIEDLASELADAYVSYFDIDVKREQQRYEDSIEECLAHLEEVCSTFEGYKQNSEDIQEFANTIIKKKNSLEELYEQVDALEQYIFETNRLLDQLDNTLGELESHTNLGGNKLKQIIGMIPKLPNIPRFRLFNSLGGFFNENSPSFIEDDSVNIDGSQIVPIDNILDNFSSIQESLALITKNLHTRLLKKRPLNFEVPELNDPMTSLGSEAQVDGSWQELL